MPRTLDPALLACLERENPSAELYVEITAPNVSRVLRRPNDQLLLSPDPQVSLTPAASIVSAPSGGVALASTSSTLVSFLAGGSGAANVDQEDPATRIKGVSWAVDPAFDRAVIRSFTARLRRSSSSLTSSFELQVYRASGQWGVLKKEDGTLRAFFFWNFVPMLAVPAVVRSSNITWTANVADVVFDLTTAGLVVDGSKEGLPSNSFSGRPTFYFSVRRITPAGLGVFTWQADAVTSRTVAGVGIFDQTWWSRTRAGDAWAQTNFGQVPQCSIQVESYNPAGGFAQAVYKIDLGATPAAGTVGRIRFERSTPLGTVALLELSTAGSGGPWVTVADGDPVAVVQQLYHLRVKWTPSASFRSTPIVSAVGIEFRTPYDVTRESVIAPLSRDVEMPYGAATIGDGEVKVLRTGRRDFADVATLLGSTQPTTKLEVDVFLKSPHPLVTRAKWLRLDRASVQDRIPSETNERFLLLSYLMQLKRKIPLPVETINSVYTVNDIAHGAAADPTALRVYVTPALQGATGGGTEYTAKNYYMRVRASSQSGVGTGTVALISSHTSAVALNFGAGVLNGVLAYGDTIEVHSGVLAAPALSYKDQDPATVWWDILVNQIGIPPERIGMGHLPRGGLPPTVVDRAPGDATTQAKYKVSLALEKAESGDQLLDQLSFIVGGSTIEIAGQLCFVQLYPLRDGTGSVSVPLPVSSRTFDPRDYHSTNFPIGLAQRQSAVTCEYGVDLTVPEALRTAPSQTEVVDADAVLWTGLSAADSRGRSNIPDEIARWCYNSTDTGLLLASELAHQIVQYFGTGRRIWEWSTRDAYRQHHAGDVVTIVTDQYSDYDPSGLTAIAGWQSVTVVLLGVSADGRKFRGVVPGVNASTMRRAGGNAGATGGADSAIACPTISLARQDHGTVGRYATPRVEISWTAPSSPLYDHMEFSVQAAALATSTMVMGTTSPTSFLGAWGVTYTVTPTVVTRAGVRTVGTPQSIVVPDSSRIKDIRRLSYNNHAGTGSLQSAGTILTYVINNTTNADLNIAAHTLTIPSGDGTTVTISFGAGSIVVSGTGNRGIKLYVYADDTGYAGSSSYVFTSVPLDLSGSASRYYVGDITIPAGASGTGGGTGYGSKKV